MVVIDVMQIFQMSEDMIKLFVKCKIWHEPRFLFV